MFDIDREVERRIAERKGEASIWGLTFMLILLPFKSKLFRVIICFLLGIYLFYYFGIVPASIWVESTFKIRVFTESDDEIRKEYARFGQTPWWDDENETAANEATVKSTSFSFIATDGSLIVCDL